MASQPFNLFGIPLPFSSPWFLGLVGIHIFAGLTCVFTGLLAMFSGKAPGRHPKSGTIYYWALLVVFSSSTLMSILRLAEDYPLLLLGGLAFAAATFGRNALRHRQRGWARLHIAGMGTSYVLLLTAFYVDNGKSLPLWRDLPVIVYWLLPAAIGLPLIVRALMNHPVVRQSD